MTLEDLLLASPPAKWEVAQLHATGWYDGPEEGVCALAVPGGEFYFEKVGERYNPEGLDDRLFRLSELPAGSVAEVLAVVPRLANQDETIRKRAEEQLAAICARRRPTAIVIRTPDWEHFLGCWRVDRTNVSDWFADLNIPPTAPSYAD